MLSVIIPVYNGEATIGALLDSLAANDYKGCEIIVVDDGSTDRTREVASARSVKLLSTGGRRGPAVGRNIGAKAAAGDVLLFLDADTLAPPHLLGHVAKRFASAPEPAAIVGYYDKFPLNEGRFARYKALMVHYWFRKAEVMESFETCCGAIRKSAFIEAGGFDERYADADVEDYEFGWRVMKQGKILVDHEMVVGHHFPSFTKNFRNYYRRAKLWMPLFLERKRFESTATTPGEGAVRLFGALVIACIPASILWPKLLYATLFFGVIYLYMLKDFLKLLVEEEGLLFAIWGLGAHALSSVAIALGAAAGLTKYLLNRVQLLA